MTQIDTVKHRLDTLGEISRNWCLRNFITRLSAIMLKLKKQGYVYTTKTETDKHGRQDFIYMLSGLPKQAQNQGDISVRVHREGPRSPEENQIGLQLKWKQKEIKSRPISSFRQ